MKAQRFVNLAFREDKITLPRSIANRQLRRLRLDQLLNHIAKPYDLNLIELVVLIEEQRCKKCGCTYRDCTQCVEKTGSPCHWVAADLCSACVPKPVRKSKRKVRGSLKSLLKK